MGIPGTPGTLFIPVKEGKVPWATGELLVDDIGTTLIGCRLKNIICHSFVPPALDPR